MVLPMPLCLNSGVSLTVRVAPELSIHADRNQLFPLVGLTFQFVLGDNLARRRGDGPPHVVICKKVRTLLRRHPVLNRICNIPSLCQGFLPSLAETTDIEYADLSGTHFMRTFRDLLGVELPFVISIGPDAYATAA